MKKLLVALMVVLSVFSAAVLADTSSNYQVDNVYLDNMDISSATINVERGETKDLNVYLQGTGETTDVNVRAWIGGYEYDNVQVTSDMFQVEDGISYKKTLKLVIPEDLNANQDYTLYVEIYDDVDSVSFQGTIHVSKVRHLLSTVDVLVDNSVNAGDYTTATVRLKDMGDKKEEDIKVTVSIPELGISKSVFLNELTNNEIDNLDEESSGSVDLTFAVPSDAKTGDYKVNVEVSYNSGYSTLEDSTSLHVEAKQVAETQSDSSVVVVSNDNTASTSTKSGSDFSTALRLGFGILAVLIVILALILIVRR